MAPPTGYETSALLAGPLVFRRPELRGDICSLIGLVNHGHVGGELSIPVDSLVKMLGVNMRRELHEQLLTRGDLHFSGSRFRNVGPVIQRQVRLMGMPMNLEVASPLAGEIGRDHGAFDLHFEPGASFTLGRFVFETELATLRVATEEMIIRFRTGPEVRIELG